jgi:hypothetical protein
MWFENSLKYSEIENCEFSRFKYKDYYSIYGINAIVPINILDIIDIKIDSIAGSYKIKKELVEEKQKELYEYCKTYFKNIDV